RADDDELGHEADRRLVDRGRRLDHADHHAADERGQQDRRGRERRDPQRLLGDADEKVPIFHGSAFPPHHVANEPAREPMVSAQPSTSTNKSSLNGIEMIVGESIIMPSAIRVEATTMSMMRNGRKIMKPIWNAVLSSLVTKAGSRMLNGMSAA